MSIRVAVTCRLGLVNPREFVKFLAKSDDLEVFVITDSANYPEIDFMPHERIYHYHPSWPTRVIFGRIHPYTKYKYDELLDEIEPDIMLSMGVSQLIFMSTTADFFPAVLYIQGGEIRRATTSKGQGLSQPWRIMFRLQLRELLNHVEETWTSSVYQETLKSIGMPESRYRPEDMFPVDTEMFSPSENPISFSSDNKDVVIGCFRRVRNEDQLHSYKILFKSISILANRRDDFEVVIGGMYENEEEENSKIKKVQDTVRGYVDKYDISEKVHFLSMVDKKEMPRYYSGLDIYVNTDSSDQPGGIGTGSKEAMACGCAYTTFNEEKEYIIEDGENGLIFPLEDPDAELVADKLETLCEDEEYRERLGKAARETVVQEFSREAVNEKVVSAFREILDKQ